MITITVSDIELYDNSKEEFTTKKGGTFRFEHSLIAVSKWESKWKVPFLATKLTNAQTMSYLEMMCLDKGFTRDHLTPEVVEQLTEYMEDTHTATVFKSSDNHKPGPIMTSEVLYAYMVNGNVPFECAKWNLNRLIMLLNVVASQKEPPKKMSRNEILQQNAKLNAERKAKLKTKG